MDKHIEMDISPSAIFASELEKVQAPLLRAMAVEALLLAPSYFWVVPASSSGKYHPVSSLGMHGLVRHVKSVFWVSEELLSHRLYAPFSDHEKDLIRVAILLHDACKQGIEEWGTNTVTEHPLLVREHLRPDVFIQNTEGAEQDWDTICSLIETHMGIWTKDYKSGAEVLKEPETAMQKFVHLCDYLASRKSITVDIQNRERQTVGGTNVEDSATEKQIGYLKALYLQAHNRGVVLPTITYTDSAGKIILTKSQAGEHITNAKNALEA